MTAESWDEPGWGVWGREEPCKHLLALRDFMKAQGLDAWSEHGTDPDGWVNVGCEKCGRTYEVVLSNRNVPEEDGEQSRHEQEGSL
jgi:hypothetical protein